MWPILVFSLVTDASAAIDKLQLGSASYTASSLSGQLARIQ